MNSYTTQWCLDRMQITDVVNNVATCADLHDWQGLRDCFANAITVDDTTVLATWLIRPGNLAYWQSNWLCCKIF